jgi:hypothetical protein
LAERRDDDRDSERAAFRVVSEILLTSLGA